MEPSEIRRAILDDHHDLRTRLHALALEVEKVRGGAAPGPLRDAILSLLDRLTEHMAREDEILAPALLETDAWGPWRVDKMKAHHAEDRERIAALRRSLTEDPLAPDDLIRAAVHLISDLHAEMADEDRTLLHPDILRDDLISSGIGG